MSISRHSQNPDSDDPPTEAIPAIETKHACSSRRGGFSKWVRRLAVPIIIVGLGLMALLSAAIPPLEKVGEMRAVSMMANEAASTIAMKHIGEVFHEYTSTSSVMVVLESDQPLGQDAHAYYDKIIAKLKAETKHVEHIQDFWGDRLTAAGAQSADGKAAYVQVNTAGNLGESLANESINVVKQIVDREPAPAGVKVFVTGSTALNADQEIASVRSMKMIESVTIAIITVMLLLVYRSIVTVVVALVIVSVGVGTATGVVAFLGYYKLIGLTSFATTILAVMAIAAATDYAIFLIGRYHEARNAGEDREQAYYTMFGSTAHVVLGSGLTIAGATLCLHFTRLPYFKSLGFPLAIGMVVVVITSLTVGAAFIAVVTRFGKMLEPKVKNRERQWRKIGAAVVRWPGPTLVAATAVALVGLLLLPTYTTSYNDRRYLAGDLPANSGFQAADRHFSVARMNPEMLMIETDHDLRNSADFLVIERVAKRVTQVPGISRVMAITRPQGMAMRHSTIPFTLGMQGITAEMSRQYNEDRTADMLTQAAEMDQTIGNLTRIITLAREMQGNVHEMTGKMHALVADVKEMRAHIADFEDFFRPIRNYFYWEPHCFDIPVCSAFRSIFDAIDGIDKIIDNVDSLVINVDRLDAILPKMINVMPTMLETLKVAKNTLLTGYATQKGLQEQAHEMQKNATAMGDAFDNSKNDDSFYLPPETFDNPEFQRSMPQFVSPDGRAVRFIISQEGDPLTPEGIKRIDSIREAAKEAIKTTPWEGSKIYLGGSAAMYKDMQEAANYDLMIAVIASVCLIFLIMLVLTRAVAAALVIVGTVVISLGTAFGISILIWQHIIGLPLQWMVPAMALIILLAVGADYNLLLVARLKEEIHAGLDTGMIRAMGGSGSVVTAAGLVFAFTMMVMAVSELKVIGQVGTTIGIGLLLDTLIIRAFMTPAVVSLLGKWFWWPHLPRQRPRPQPWPEPAERG
ncbi:MMPL family transporter [Mycobacteroides abscessus]|uniref:RND family transporter n=1 Tax=Mycobacteroides abscessus TaxID=36809 RepID=UPI0034CEB543